jgi:hypothetical protein
VRALVFWMSITFFFWWERESGMPFLLTLQTVKLQVVIEDSYFFCRLKTACVSFSIHQDLILFQDRLYIHEKVEIAWSSSNTLKSLRKLYVTYQRHIPRKPVWHLVLFDSLEVVWCSCCFYFIHEITMLTQSLWCVVSAKVWAFSWVWSSSQTSFQFCINVDQKLNFCSVLVDSMKSVSMKKWLIESNSGLIYDYLLLLTTAVYMGGSRFGCTSIC